MLIIKRFVEPTAELLQWYEKKKLNGLVLFEDEHRILTIDDEAERQEQESERRAQAINVIALKRTPLIVASAQGDLEQISLLFASGADPVAPDAAGMTPLHEAALRGQAEAVRVLIQFGVDVEVTNPHDNITPIHQAAFSHNPEVIHVLHEYGADLNKRTLPGPGVPQGDSALLRAERHLKYMLEQSSNPDYSAEFEKVWARYLLETENYYLPTVESCRAVVNVLTELGAVE